MSDNVMFRTREFKLSVDNIKQEQVIRKQNREMVRNGIKVGFASKLSIDIAGHIASFAPITMPISKASIEQIEKIFHPQRPSI